LTFESVNPSCAAAAIEARKPQRSYLDSAEQIAALLNAAGELDAAARADRQHVARRPLLATLVFAGLRIGELLELRWADVDLAGGWITVRASKTDAGVRRVKVRPALRDELAAHKASSAAWDGYVFGTAAGKRQSASNVRVRVLARARERASERLEGAGGAPMPAVTPHGLRRSFASLLYAIGEPPPVVMAEMGHTDPALALAVYAHAMRRSDDEVARLIKLVTGSPAPEIHGDAVHPSAVARWNRRDRGRARVLPHGVDHSPVFAAAGRRCWSRVRRSSGVQGEPGTRTHGYQQLEVFAQLPSQHLRGEPPPGGWAG
jgi:integrase